MLRACNRLLRAGGRTAFLTITTAPGLSKKEHRRAARLGPRSVASRRPVEDLLMAAGFEDVRVDEVTAEFARTAEGWQDGFRTHEGEVRALLGDEFDERYKNRDDLIAGIGEGLLQRFLVSGVKS